MVIIEKSMHFKRTYYTKEATAKLRIDDRTLWRWGDSGRLKMFRASPTAAREFDADQIDKLAPKIPPPEKRHKGVDFFPPK